MSGSKIEIMRVNQNNMEKQYEIKTTDSQILRVKAVRGTNLFATKWYLDIYILEGVTNSSKCIAKVDDNELFLQLLMLKDSISCMLWEANFNDKSLIFLYEALLDNIIALSDKIIN
jgi:hypothetical protein